MSNDATGVAATPDNQAAIDFLKLVYPEGPWVLTAIRPDRKAIETRTFRPKDAEALLTWLKRYNNERNIYWQVNPPINDTNKKSERENVKELAYLHVDIDPRAGEELDAEHARIRKLLTTNLPDGVPPPTRIVFSGGGYQAFWQLEVPFPINGEPAAYEEAKRWNQQLEYLFGADNCHNVDRIMRLPGTVNIPDARKFEKGRKAVTAFIVGGSDVAYPLSKFRQMPSQSVPTARSSVRTKIDVGSIKRIEDVNELDRWRVSDRVKVLCVQGNDPENATKYPSRSEALFDAVCQLTRAQVPDAVIFSIITDPSFAISESVLEKDNPRKYAKRQIDRARDEAEHPKLRELNDKHFLVLNYGGKVAVTTLDESGKFPKLAFQSVDAFCQRYMNDRIELGIRDGKPFVTELGKWWLRQPQRRQYEGVVLAPEREAPQGYYNLWQGFSVKPKAGDWSLIQRHVLEVLADGNEQHAEYIFNWAAWAVQHPAEVAEVALVFRGGHGTGKSMFIKALLGLFGSHGWGVSGASEFTGKFTGHLLEVCLLGVHEAEALKDSVSIGKLKALLTEQQLQFEDKGLKPIQASNCMKVIMASNEELAVHTAIGDRRFQIFDVSSMRKGDYDYFAALDAQTEDPSALAAMLHDLLTRDLGQWHPRRIVETQARNDQINASLDGAERFMFEILQSGEFPLPKTNETRALRDMGRVNLNELCSYAYEMLGQKVTPHKLGKVIRKLGFHKRKGDSMNGWEPPLLPDVRKLWDAYFAPARWDAETRWAGIGKAVKIVEKAANDRGPF